MVGTWKVVWGRQWRREWNYSSGETVGVEGEGGGGMEKVVE